MITMPNGLEVDIPMGVFAFAVFFPLGIITIVTMFILGPALSLGLLGIMACTAGIVWLGSRGTDWMEPKKPVDNDWFFDKFDQQ